MSPNLGFSDVFLLIRLGLWVWGKNTTKVKSASHHVRGYKYPLTLLIRKCSTLLITVEMQMKNHR